ncbi:GD11943 [Drosophila simulans]|uniref:GD11943 n=1 Tax=Drosophila simulans TaxID=7240 RepID=B4NTI6_DROSI|nr:GD11943 [Drosophila simulans]
MSLQSTVPLKSLSNISPSPLSSIADALGEFGAKRLALAETDSLHDAPVPAAPASRRPCRDPGSQASPPPPRGDAHHGTLLLEARPRFWLRFQLELKDPDKDQEKEDDEDLD